MSTRIEVEAQNPGPPAAARERRSRLLVADDQPFILEALTLLLRPEGYVVETARSPAAVLECLENHDYDALLMDLNYTRDTTSGTEGLQLLDTVRQRFGQLPVVLMTAWANVDLAVDAMRRGASDFVQKPWENTRLLSVVKTQIELYHAHRRTQFLEAENRLLRADASGVTFIATAASMRPVIELMERIGPSDANVLVTGEHGTGKEVVAQTLHRLSHRAGRPLVAVNTGALPEGTFESELFGHVKGAFTDARADRIGRFELASGGTLFLDEIANIPLRQQSKLLRVLETGEMERVGSSATRRVDVRMISATNADLREETASGRFREDLFFRLNTVEIRLPSLRERRDDIPALAAHFLSQYSARYRRVIDGFETSALQQLLSHTWPGNVRELDHTMERAVLMARGARIAAADLGLHAAQRGGASMTLDDMSLEAVEAVLVRKALARTGGNVSHAAEALGLSRGALYRRMEKHGL